ncbi:MAG: hypothetical protein IT461_06710 [Planctomycetes bacterium]|nr:hypothetical protein [Planctomycetota bacterium]
MAQARRTSPLVLISIVGLVLVGAFELAAPSINGKPTEWVIVALCALPVFWFVVIRPFLVRRNDPPPK